MSSFTSNVDESGYGNRAYDGAYGGGWGGASSIILLVVVFVVVFFLLFRDGHKDGIRDGGFGWGHGFVPPVALPAFAGHGFDGCGCCEKGCKPVFRDESNFEEEKHILADLCKVDRDVIMEGCKTREVEHEEGSKTRALIEQNYIQDLRDKLTEKAAEIQTLKMENYLDAKVGGIDAKIAMLNGAMEKGFVATNFDLQKNFCKTDAEIARLGCELPKRPPVFADCAVPCTRGVVPSGCGEGPKRFCDFE